MEHSKRYTQIFKKLSLIRVNPVRLYQTISDRIFAVDIDLNHLT